MGEIATLGRSGHTLTKWDETLPETVTEAKVTFDDLVGQGFTAFRTIAEAPPEQIREFDQTAERILMLPRFVGG
jgi:hypothetical protein